MTGRRARGEPTEGLTDVKRLLFDPERVGAARRRAQGFGLFLTRWLAAEEAGDLRRVVDGVVPVAVVHQDVHLLRRRRHLLDAGHPLLELGRLVAVPEAERCARDVGGPGFSVAPVEADDGQVGGDVYNGWEGGVEA